MNKLAGRIAACIAVACWGGAGALAQMTGMGEVDETAAELDSAPVEAGPVEGDPWEGFNRKMFAAHVFLDETLLIPAAKAYRAVTPRPARSGLRNFLGNAGSAKTFVNDILQGQFGRAGETGGRFLINSTIGFLGFTDTAAKLGIEPHREDFGQTLAVWGVDSGPYLFLPLFGPSTLRDTFGSAVDRGTDFLMYVRTDPAAYAGYARGGASALAYREPFIEPLEEIQANSLDYYASLRSFYLQARKREIANGVTTYEDLPDIGEFEEFEDLE